MADNRDRVALDDPDLQIIDEEIDGLIILDQQSHGNPRHAALEKVQTQVDERYRQEALKVDRQKTQREVERAHSLYIHTNLSTPEQRRDAEAVVSNWVQKNSIKYLDKNRMALASTRNQFQKNSREPVNARSIPQAGTSHSPDSVDETCPVINCGARFTDRSLFQRHMEIGPHTMCNPLSHLPNCRLYHNTTAHVCPMCGVMCMKRDDCREHMWMVGHDVLMSPLAVGGFACPQCLHISPDFAQVRSHMQHEGHTHHSYRMADDTQETVEPVLMPRVLVEDYMVKCRDVPWHVECLSCSKRVDVPNVAEHASKQHKLMAFTDTTPCELFAVYLKNYTCVQCYRLFNQLPPEGLGAIHKCDPKNPDVLGLIVENDVKTFAEFVRRLSLSLLEGVEDETVEEKEEVIGEVGRTEDHNVVRKSDGSSSDIIEISTPPRPANPRGLSEQENQSNDIKDRVHCETSDKEQVHPSIVDDVNVGRCGTKRPHTESYPVSMKQSCCSLDRVKSEVDTVAANKDLPHSLRPSDGQEYGARATNETFNTSESAEVVRMLSGNESEMSHRGEGAVSQRNKTVQQKANMSQSVARSSEQVNQLHSAHTETVTHPGDPIIHTLTSSGGKGGGSSRSSLPSGSAQSCLPSTSDACQAAAGQPGGVNTSGQSKASSGPEQMEWHPDGSVLGPYVQLPSNSGYNTHVPAYHPSGSSGSSRITPVCRSITPQNRLSPAIKEKLPEPEHIAQMKHIIFLDLDNWPSFFSRLPNELPDQTLVWGFYGGNMKWKEPIRCLPFQYLKNNGGFFLHDKCGRTKDAADFALVMQVARLDERLPKHIPFTILSGDKGFCEVERQMANSERRAVVIDPHHKDHTTLYMLIKSVAEV